jgi:aspartate aminotransferase
MCVDSAMTSTASPALDFGNQAELDQSLSALSRRLRGSSILKIAATVRAMIAAGKPVCNLTVGDFDPKQFPIPDALRRAIVAALDAGETSYPPSDGVMALRQAVRAYLAREQGVAYPVESVLIAGGGRPGIYAFFRTVVDPGDTVVYPVPSWNNDHYSNMTEAKVVTVAADRETGFQPTLAQLEPHLASARLICLCSPANPTGTVMAADELRLIMEAVVAENARRQSAGERPLFVLFDQMYGSLAFPPAQHHNPVALVPEAAPWTLLLDGVSKAFAGTGLRVGWTVGAPAVIARMKDLLGHVGAWAPRPEQVGTARFLNDETAIAEYRRTMHAGIKARLDALYEGFQALRKDGYRADCIHPQGALYLSLQLDLVGRRIDGRPIRSNEDIRQLLLEGAGLAVVPFQAFGLEAETGWFRISVGAVSLQDIEDAFPRVRALLDRVR